MSNGTKSTMSLDALYQKSLTARGKSLEHPPSTNPPSSPPTPASASRFYLQIRICEEHYSGAKHVKKEYRISLPANVVGLDEEGDYRINGRATEKEMLLSIPVILQEPSSGSVAEATQAAQSPNYSERQTVMPDGRTRIDTYWQS